MVDGAHCGMCCHPASHIAKKQGKGQIQKSYLDSPFNKGVTFLCIWSDKILLILKLQNFTHVRMYCPKLSLHVKNVLTTLRFFFICVAVVRSQRPAFSYVYFSP
jgi:hypothetical protein